MHDTTTAITLAHQRLTVARRVIANSLTVLDGLKRALGRALEGADAAARQCCPDTAEAALGASERINAVIRDVTAGLALARATEAEALDALDYHNALTL